jgi:metallophosphoesterase (TIGR00282 family)
VSDRSGTVRILFVGDVVGRPGRRALRELAPQLRAEVQPDFVIVNAENSAGGFGFDRRSLTALFEAGADVLTNGNHTWDKPGSLALIAEDSRLLRPANYPADTPGAGHRVFTAACGVKIGVVNLLGRVFMTPYESPFRRGLECLESMRDETAVLVVDFHGEATSEKAAFAWHVDGLASAVLGTHTHVPTADERIFPKGTAFQSDVGMTGGYAGVIGMKVAGAVQRFVGSVPVHLEPAMGDLRLDATAVDVDTTTGRAVRIRRLQKCLEG